MTAAHSDFSAEIRTRNAGRKLEIQRTLYTYGRILQSALLFGLIFLLSSWYRPIWRRSVWMEPAANDGDPFGVTNHSPAV